MELTDVYEGGSGRGRPRPADARPGAASLAANQMYLGGMSPSGRPRSGRALDPLAELRGSGIRVGAALVLNAAGQVLAGFNLKRQCWDLPQGTVELGEEPLGCALRELLEETGLAAGPADVELVGRFQHMTPSFVAGWETSLYAVTECGLDVSGARNLEPDKCSQLSWFSPCQMPQPRGLSLRCALALLGAA